MENRALKRSILFLLSWQLCLVTDGYTQQLPKGLTAANGVYIGFYEYKPSDYSLQPDTKYPLIIFMHGIGERGNGTSDLSNLLNIALPKYINQGHPMRFYWNGKWETFLVLSPQLSGMYGNWENFYIDEMLKHAKTNLRVDTNRIFLTGLSLGGGGTWSYAGASLENAKKFAGIAPVCGTCQGVNWCNFANAKLPVWAFHAQDDGIVGAGCTEGAISNINNCNPAVKPIKTIWPDGNHFIWDRAYDTAYSWQNPNLFEWFLGQNKSLPVNQLPVANAGTDIMISTADGSATLNGTASTDVDGNIVKYIWKKISGPSNCTINNPASSTTSVNGLSATGTYQFELTVVDNRTAINKDIVNINVTSGSQPPAVNLPPVANAGGDIFVNLPVSQTTLIGSGSTDADGNITNYQWTKVNGPSSYNIINNVAPNTTVTDLVQGRYEFKLKVTDNKGATAEDLVVIIVTSADKPPVSDAGDDLTITLPVSQVTLNGSRSHDAEGTLINYQWNKIAGPTNYNIGNVNSVSTPVSNLTEGIYFFTLRVWDNNWIPSDDTVIVKVLPPLPPPPNRPPVAHAGSDVTITLPTNAITLNGSTSSDPDGNIANYIWSKISGPSTYTIATPSAISTVIYNFGAGVYAFQLVVKDQQGLVHHDTVTVTVNAAPSPPPSTNKPPVANGGPDKTITLPANEVMLSAVASTDPDGAIKAYSWSRISGPLQYYVSSPNGMNSRLSSLIAGTYIFKLEVFDDHGAINADTVVITVLTAPNHKPYANAGSDISIMLPLNNTSVNGGMSYDPEGPIPTYIWTKVSGPSTYQLTNPTQASSDVKNLGQGTYHFRLLVTDAGGLTDDDTIQITVHASPNRSPIANAGNDTTGYLPNTNILLNGTASYDPDGTIQSHTWVRINGPGSMTIINSTSNKASVSGLQEGNHIFQLTVKDNKGATASDQVKVSIRKAPNKKPVADAGTDTTIALPATSAVLNGKRSYDPDGKLVKFKWKQINGPAVSRIDMDTSITTVIRYLIPGEYIYELSVTDNNGSNHSDSIIVTVVNNFKYQEQVSIFPNPARDYITIRCFSDTIGTTSISVYNNKGTIIKSYRTYKSNALLEHSIPVYGLKSGVYYIEVNLNGKKEMITRFIKL